MSVLRCERLEVGWRGQALLPPLDLALEPGELITVVGRNGSGKTTWFRTLLGLIPPVRGQVVRSRPDLRVAYVPQVASIDPLLPLRADDVLAWSRLSGWGFLRPRSSKADRAARARALEEAGAEALSAKPYGELSEGQKQRILFARLLATEAEVALLDEPTSAMDAVAERQTFAKLRALADERKLAVVVVSHVLGAAVRAADRVLFMDRDRQVIRLGDAATVLGDPAFRDAYGDHL
jgi:zinc transport system ATP-binding protein